MMSVRLLSHSELKSAVRGRVCFVDCLCTTLGWHNGRAAPPAKSMQFEEPSPGPILGFLDSICKVNLNSDSAFFWLENITSVGSAFFMLMDGPHRSQIDRLRVEYSEEQGVAAIPESSIWWCPYRSKERFWGFLDREAGRLLSVFTLAPYDVHTSVGDAAVNGVCLLALRTESQDCP